MISFSDPRFYTLLDAIEEASKVSLRFWPGSPKGPDSLPLNPQKKADGSYVTDGDLTVNRIIVEKLKELFPDEGILSEELPISESLRSHDYLWIIDPIDGTHNFMEGKSEFAILVARAFKGEVIAGFTYLPTLGKGVVAEKGRGAWFGADKLQVSTNSELRDGHAASWNCLIEPPNLRHPGPLDLNRALTSLGAGKLDIMIERIRGQGTWDIACRLITIKEAGGMVTDEAGKRISFDLKTIHSRFIVSSNGKLHAQALTLVPKS